MRTTAEGQAIHDRIPERMLRVLTDTHVPSYLDATARELLSEARANFDLLGLGETRLLALDQGGEVGTLILPWAGTAAVGSIMPALISGGIEASPGQGSRLTVETKHPPEAVEAALRELAGAPAPDGVWLASLAGNLRCETFHDFLTQSLLAEDAASSRLVAPRVPEIASSLLMPDR